LIHRGHAAAEISVKDSGSAKNYDEKERGAAGDPETFLTEVGRRRIEVGAEAI
jgi:hypothetical protein